MQYQQAPQLLKQDPQRLKLANLLTNPSAAPFGNINSMMQNMAFKKGMQNNNLGNWGLNNDFGPAGIPVDQWMNMRGR